jgi:hypothetical protein
VFRSPKTLLPSRDEECSNGDAPLGSRTLLDGTPLDGERQYRFDWAGAAPGTYSALAKVHYGTGQTVESSTIQFHLTAPLAIHAANLLPVALVGGPYRANLSPAGGTPRLVPTLPTSPPPTRMATNPPNSGAANVPVASF